MLLGNNGLTHRFDFLCGNEVIFKILTNVHRSLDVGKINVPLTDSVNVDVAIVEDSAPEGTVNVAGENLGEHASFLGLVKYASSLDYKAVIELNVIGSELDNVNDDCKKRNQRQYTEHDCNHGDNGSDSAKEGHLRNQIFTHKCGDSSQSNKHDEEENSSEFECGKNTLSRYDMRSGHFHFKTPFKLHKAVDIF